MKQQKDMSVYAKMYRGKAMSKGIDCNNGCHLFLIKNTSGKEYQRYLLELGKAGLSRYDSQIIRDNYFATYINELVLVQAYYTSHDNTTRLIIDPNTNKYTRKQDVVYEELCATKLYQMETDYRRIDCGMCYIIQCADGSFFIVDSAHMNSEFDHIRLYNLLYSLALNDNEIIIAGWFLSHAHQDHICKFMDFVKSDFPNCKIEALYYNFPQLTVEGSENWSASDKLTMMEFDEMVESHPELYPIKIHSGQKIYVRNLQIDVLATHEDIYPYSLQCFNNSSTIIRVTVSDCSILFLGDADVAEGTILVARYGEYLKSDIVQVAHHGYNASNVGIYYNVKANVALYPTRQDKFEENSSTASNRAILEFSEEIYIAGNGMVVLALPYHKNSAIVYDQEINNK